MQTVKKHSRQWVAEAYRQASLQELDMHQCVDYFEQLREQLAGADDAFQALNAFQQALGAALDEPAVAGVLSQLRDEVQQFALEQGLQLIESAYEKNPSTGWQTHLSLVARALEDWNVPLTQQFIQLPLPVPEEQRPLFEELRQQVQYLQQCRYADISPLFERLAAQEWMDVELRIIMYILGESVQIYQLYDFQKGQELVEAAKSLAPSEDHPRVIRGEAEWLIQNGEYEEARRMLLKGITLQPDDSLYLAVADAYREEGLVSLAKEWNLKTLDHYPGCGEAYNRLIRLCSDPEFFDKHQQQLQDWMQKYETLHPDIAFNTYLEAAVAMQQVGQEEEAHHFYKEGIQKLPNSPQPYVYYADFLLGQDPPWDEAKSLYEKAIDIAPEAFSGQWGMGWYYEQTEDWDQAVEAYRACLLLRPEWDYFIHQRIGQVQYRAGALEEAEATWLQALELRPDYQETTNSLHQLVDHYNRDRQQSEKALEILGAIRSRRGKDYEQTYQNRQGVIFYENGAYDRAAEHYRAALEENPQDAIIWDNLGQAYEKLEQLDKAEEAYFKGLEYDPEDPAMHNRLGLMCDSQGNWEQALEHYASAAHLAPEVGNYHYNQGIAHVFLKQPQEAAEAFQKAAELKPDDPKVFNQLGNTWYDLYQWQAAAEAYQKALALEPANPQFLANLAVTQARLEDWEGAEATYQKLLPIAPDFYNLYGNFLLDQGKLEEAQEAYRKAIEKNDPLPVYYENLGYTEQMLEKYELAKEAFEKALELDPTYAAAYNRLGNLYFYLSDFRQALPWYQKALEYGPKQVIFWSNLGLTYANLERWEEALNAYQSAADLEPLSGKHYFDMGMLQFSRQQYTSARDFLTKAVEIEPQAIYYDGLGRCCQELEDYPASIDCFEKALQLDPDNDVYYTRIGISQTRMQNHQLALENYQKSIELNGEVAIYHENIGLALEALDRPEEALAAYQKAMELDPEDGRYPNRIGIFYYNQGEFERAAAFFQKATACPLIEPVFFNNLGMALQELGEEQRAQEAFRNAENLE